MDKLKKHIIVVAYQFCPMGGIGTRRWSKFAKYLTENNYVVHVICSDNKNNNNPINWCGDVLNNNDIKIYKIKTIYPSILLSPNRVFIVKFFERLIKLFAFSIDFAQYSQKSLEIQLVKLINKHNIYQVIATGAPFSPFYYLAKIKKKFDFELILDYRDPWNRIYKFKGLFKNIFRRKSIKKEYYAILNADKLLFTTQQLNDIYIKDFPKIKDKSYVIYNGYDKLDYINIGAEEKLSDNIIKFIYAGSLTNGRAEAISLILKALNNIETDLKVEIHLYCQTIDGLIKMINNEPKLKSYIKHFNPIDSISILEKIRDADYCISINERHFPYLIGAKTFDYFGLKKQIFHISPIGELSSILIKNSQYVTDYNIIEIEANLKKCIEDYKNSNIIKIDYDDFDIDIITKKLIDVLNLPNPK